MLLNLKNIQDNDKISWVQAKIDNLEKNDVLQEIINSIGTAFPTEYINYFQNTRELLKHDLNEKNQIWWKLFTSNWNVIQSGASLFSFENLKSYNKVSNKSNRMQIILAANYDYQPFFITTIKSLLYYNNVDIHLVNPDIPNTCFTIMNQLI